MTKVAERTAAARRGIPQAIRIFLLIATAGGLDLAASRVFPALPADRPIAVPILVYHRFGPVAVNDMTVTTAAFQAQIEQLVVGGYTVISLERLVGYFLGSAPAPPPCSVVLTADDAHRSIYEDMAPAVEKYRLPVTLFVYPSAISNAAWALTWQQLDVLHATGLFDIQSHTFWHPNFHRERERLDAEAYERFVDFQLSRSKAVLEQRLRIHVNLLAWPFGIYDDDLMRQARGAGYVAAFTLQRLPATRQDALLALPRYLVQDSDRGPRFECLLGCAERR
jgi:peptidoglycan/xylan/chitin deacetylase (PgdA/CDA1 family)